MRLALFVLAALATACQAPPPGSDLFPLDAGHRWTYDVRSEWENQVVEHETQSMRTLPPETYDGAPAWRRRSESGVDYWLRRDDSGTYRVASKIDLEEDPRPDKERRYVLKTPIAVGTNWRASTTAYLLRRRAEFPREIRHSHPHVPMNYTIEAVDDAVAVRAGRYSGCTRVKGVATVRVFADPVAGWRDMPLVTTEWYCPGVGLVKLVREEPAESTFLSGGKLTMELVDWK